MKKKIPERKILPLLSNTLYILRENKIILFPYMIILFLQLLLLEILYFFPRYPLNKFFNPIVSKLWSDHYLHYPLNFVLLPKLYQYLLIPSHIFLNSLLICMSIIIISNINNSKHSSIKKVFIDAISRYVHIVVATILSFILVISFFRIYEIFYDRASIIRSSSGIYFIIKSVIMVGAPYINLVLSVFATAIFVFLLPLIMIDKKNVFAAIIANFRLLRGSFWYLFFVILIPSVMYIPILLLRNSLPVVDTNPGIIISVLILSAIFMVAIDAMIYTSITSYYLLLKERK